MEKFAAITSNKTKNKRVTKRDIEIINFINLFGFSTMPHLQKRFGLKKERSYQITRRLIRLGLIKHDRIFHFQHGVYRLTQKGAKDTGLPALENVSLGSYQHDVTLASVYLKFLEIYPNATWVTERQLKKSKYAHGIAQYGHVADGLLIFPDGIQVAIEVELTFKGKMRLEKILRGYSSNFDISEVWYYCPNQIFNAVKSVAEKITYVKVFSLEEILDGGE